jgi:hypothetical protein
MRQTLTLALLLILTLACSSTSVSTGPKSDASTTDFGVTVVQADAPLTMPGNTSTDLKFVITVKNRTAEPWTIEHIALQSMGGGSYSLPVRTREFNRVLAPGAEEEFEFWGTVDLAQDTFLTRAPITLRTTLHAKNDEGKRKEQFMQKINGRVSMTAR